MENLVKIESKQKYDREDKWQLSSAFGQKTTWLPFCIVIQVKIQFSSLAQKIQD